MQPLAIPGAARSSRCASRSRTSATSAAPTACRRRVSSGSAASEILSFEEIARLVAGARAPGRRRGAADRRRAARAPRPARRSSGCSRQIDGVRDLSLTTNGVLLDRFAAPLVAAGLRRINVSLDSLNHVRFAEITRRDALDAVLRGPRGGRAASRSSARSRSTASRSKASPRTEVPALAELARRKPYVVRFIEFMPLDADEAWREDDVLTRRGDPRDHRGALRPLVELPAKASSTARRFRFADGAGELGFVNPVSEPFCSSCDRIRLTADGQLRTCLFSRREWDLKTPLRDGATRRRAGRARSASPFATRSSSTGSTTRASSARPDRCRRSADERPAPGDDSRRRR